MVTIISHADCLLHLREIKHPECPARLKAIAHSLASLKSKISLSYERAPLVTLEQLYRVHDKKYVNDLLAFRPKEGHIYLDPDTIMDPYTIPAALRAAGAVVRAVDLVMSEQASTVFCNVRPPGHHAEQDRAMGFCFFNNIAVGVAHALDVYQLDRIAIIDFDVHRGNGTEAIFLNHKNVLICSIYENYLYPNDVPKEAKNIVHIPLASDASGRDFRTKITQYGLGKINDFKPQLIFFSAGFDGHIQDNISNLNLTEFDYYWITQQIQEIAHTHSHGRMISVLEGGYALNVLGQCVATHLTGLAE